MARARHSPPSYHQGYADRPSRSAYPGLWEGLIGAWVPALGVTGGTLRDVSGHGVHGTLVSIPSTGWGISNNPRVPGYALTFDGSADYVTMGDAEAFNFTSGQMAVLVWFKTPARDILENERLVSHGFAGTDFGFDLAFNKTGDIMTFGDSAGFRKTTNVFDDGNWHRIVGQHNGTNALSGLFIYVDGIREDDDEAGTFNGFSVNSEPLTIGGSFNSSTAEKFFNGEIGEVRIYNRILAEAEILFDYYVPLAPFILRDRLFVKAPAVVVGKTKEQGMTQYRDSRRRCIAGLWI